MRLRWSPEAADELEGIYEYIATDNPQAESKVNHVIYEACQRLKRFPASGRAGRELGSRELVLDRLPYLVIYRVRGKYVEISRVWHTARNRG